MAEWLVEQGIGEERAIVLDDGEIVAARLHWPGALTAGQVEDAILVAKPAGSTRGTARFASGEEALVDGLPQNACQGANLRLKISRAAIGEAGRLKLAQARPTEGQVRHAPTLAEALESEDQTVTIVHRFPAEADWNDLTAEAMAREVKFNGGALLLSPTPAMTLIDVDGALPAKQLALAAVPAIAATLLRFDIGGSIGIDFPTLTERKDRRAVDEALDATLDGWPHERTAMNGFGFVQIVSRLDRPSILQRLTRSPAGAAARLLLRQAEGVADPGAILLTCNPAVRAKLEDSWLAELARRSGREIRVKADESLALEGGFAQAIAS